MNAQNLVNFLESQGFEVNVVEPDFNAPEHEGWDRIICYTNESGQDAEIGVSGERHRTVALDGRAV
jgi:hypothetical protein